MSEQTIHRYDFRGQALCGSSNTDDNDAPATHDPRQVTCQECQRRQLPGRCPERQPGDSQDHHFSSTEGVVSAPAAAGGGQ